MAKSVCFFDLDQTILDGTSISMWCAYIAEKGMVKDPEGFVRRELELEDIYAQGKLNLQEYLDFVIEPISTIPVATLDAMVDGFVEERILPKIYPQAKELFAKLKEQDTVIVLISTTAEVIVNSVGRALGLEPDNVIAVRLERINGFYGPKIQGVPSYQEGKVINVEQWFAKHPGYDKNFAFYTDSINDLPLCLAAAEPHAVNPCPLLLDKAQENNWPILWWKKELEAQPQ